MSVYLYLSFLPEALVGSMLPPADFGRYLALGAGKRTRAQAIFCEIDREKAADHFHLGVLDKKCVPHSDGSPHRSAYVSVYRALERLPSAAVKKLYLTAADGTTLELEPGDPSRIQDRKGFHLYQEFCPVSPRVVARAGPLEFTRAITNPENAVSVPRIAFADFKLKGLATDPNAREELPYQHLDHVRYCLQELEKNPEKISKIVVRDLQKDVPFWMIENGIFIGNGEDTLFFPMPPEDELRARHSEWWSSASYVELM